MTPEVKENLSEWLENPYWAGYYGKAPSEACREYIANEFYASDTDDDAAWKAMDELKPQLSVEDWRHLLKYSDSGPGRKEIIENIERLEKTRRTRRTRK